MKYYYYLSSLFATVFLILCLGFEVDKGEWIRLFYLFYVAISWALPGVYFRKRAINNGPIFISFYYFYSLVCWYNLIAALFCGSILLRVFGSIFIALVSGILVLVLLKRGRLTSSVE